MIDSTRLATLAGLDTLSLAQLGVIVILAAGVVVGYCLAHFRSGGTSR
jgi:hypothetical protein